MMFKQNIPNSISTGMVQVTAPAVSEVYIYSRL